MTGISTLAQALDQISRLKTQQISLDTLSQQLASGKKSQDFAGLGDDVLRTQRARADIKELEQYNNNIIVGDRRIELMTNTIQQVIDQVDIVLNTITVDMQQGDYPDFASAQSLASDVKDFVFDLMNMQDGDRYLFAGSDSSVQPIENNGLYGTFLGNFIPDPNDVTAPPLQTSGFIGEWGSGLISTDQFIAAYRSTNETVLGYSNSLSSGSTGNVTVRVDENTEFDRTVLANNTGFKNLVVALGVLENLPAPENTPGALNDPAVTRPADDVPPFPSEEKQENFYQVINDLADLINEGKQELRQDLYNLSYVRAQIDLVQQQHTYQINSYQTIVSDIEDADLTETTAKIQQLSVSLEASFSATALISDLTLVNFL